MIEYLVIDVSTHECLLSSADENEAWRYYWEHGGQDNRWVIHAAMK